MKEEKEKENNNYDNDKDNIINDNSIKMNK